jgi:hypothetical protein
LTASGNRKQCALQKSVDIIPSGSKQDRLCLWDISNENWLPPSRCYSLSPKTRCICLSDGKLHPPMPHHDPVAARVFKSPSFSAHQSIKPVPKIVPNFSDCLLTLMKISDILDGNGGDGKAFYVITLDHFISLIIICYHCNFKGSTPAASTILIFYFQYLS